MPTSLGIYYTLSQLGEQTSPPLVLIHGAGGSSLSWPPNIRRLADRTVLAPDLPNHGKSAAQETHTLEEMAFAILEWLDRLHIQQVDVCGHSMGGAISLLLALHAAPRLRRITLVGSAARLTVNPRLLELSANPSTLPQAVELLVKWSFAPSTPQRLKELTAKRLLENHPQTLFRDLTACNQFDLSTQLEHIRQPTLILCGEHDRMTPPSSAEFLANRLPNAHLVLLPEAGHMVVLEKPTQVASQLCAFFH